MASVVTSSPIQNISGKFSWKEKIAYRTRNGRTHVYAILNPYKGELAESRKAAIGIFAEAVRQCKSEMQDPVRLAYWQAEYKKHLKRTKNLSPDSRTKRYSTLRGFIIASLSAQLKANQ